MIGGTLARLAVDAGYQVVLSNSRGPETLQDLAAELGPLCPAATWAEAAEAGDLVVVSTPVKAYAGLPAAPFAGKVVMDTGNYYPERDGQLAELDSGALTSSELLARQLPGAEVVKVFNNIFFKHLLNLARPAGAADRSYLPIAGDSAAAKAAVTDVPRLDRVRGGGRGGAGRRLAPAAGDAGLRAAVRDVRRREGDARQRRGHSRGAGRGDPVTRPVRAYSAGRRTGWGPGER